jgi:hypothetical protein
MKNSLSPSASASSADNVGTRDLEADAIRAEDLVEGARWKLAEALPVLRRVHDHFTKNKRGSIRFRGCGSWTEYCDKRLHCSTDAVYMAAKRLRLKQVPDEQAKEERRLRRMQAEAERSLDRRIEEMNKNLGSGVRVLGLSSHSSSPQRNYEPPEDDSLNLGDEDRVIPETAIVRTLAALDEAGEILPRIIASGTLTIPDLLAARKCAAHIASVAEQVREEFGIRGTDTKAKVISIKARLN